VTLQIALLRGINVGGKTAIAMSDLRQMFSDLGLAEAQTVLRTGNVLFRSDDRTADQLESLLERETERRLGLRTAILVRGGDEWQRVIAANPFPEEAKRDPGHLVVMPLKDEPAAAAVSALREAIPGRETVAAVGRELFIVYPDGIGRSKLTIKLIESKLGTLGTGRNWNTALKLARLASA
jgi:uncharacterized protein (DUF1697 family)